MTTTGPILILRIITRINGAVEEITLIPEDGFDVEETLQSIDRNKAEELFDMVKDVSENEEKDIPTVEFEEPDERPGRSNDD